MNRAKFRKLYALVTALLILSSSVFAETSQNTVTVLDLFLEPDPCAAVSGGVLTADGPAYNLGTLNRR